MRKTMQILVSTMNQTDYSLLDRMNIQSDAIVVNQCDKDNMVEFEYKGYKIKWISQSNRGVGLSRNTALMNSDAEILLFADDDVVYEDGVVEKVINEFESHPKYDFIIFNFISLNPLRPENIDKKKHRIHWYNSLKYGAFRMAVKRDAVYKKNIFFSLLFGGGAEFQAGEDNLFVNKALQAGIKVLASDLVLGTVAQQESTWFKGYDERYYFDRGVLFACMFGKWAKLIMLLMVIKEKKCAVNLIKRFKLGREGIKLYYGKLKKSSRPVK